MDVLLILSVKIVMMPEELKSVFNVLLQPTEFLLSLNMLVSVKKVTMMIRESAKHAHQVVLNAPMPQFVKDVLSQLPTIPTELAHVLKAISLLLNH
jgi:hypothetical protein